LVKTLIDAGPLIALIDPKDPAHLVCNDSLAEALFPLITTWPAFTEAMYFAHRTGGWNHQRFLWEVIEAETLDIHFPSLIERQRIRELMEQYRDTPMDLADASLVAAAETLRLRRVFTLDSHFRAYRTREGDSFEIVPGKV
jgi:uncharacterized protein